MGKHIIIDFNAFHQSNNLRLLICYTGHFDEKKTAEFVSVAICVSSYLLNTVLLLTIVLIRFLHYMMTVLLKGESCPKVYHMQIVLLFKTVVYQRVSSHLSRLS